MELFKEMYTRASDQDQTIGTFRKTERPRVVYEELLDNVTSKNNLSSLAQYFLAPFILIEPNGILDIPATDEFVHDKIVREIAPHFCEKQKISIGNRVTIRLKSVRENSKAEFLNLLNRNEINAIVKDLFACENSNWGGSFTSKEYEVNLEAIEKKARQEIVSMWNFFERAFIQNGMEGQLVLIPSGWEFNESFKDRISIRAFAGVCNSMTVTVNCENEMISSVFID